MIEAGAMEVSEDTVADALRIRARTDQAASSRRFANCTSKVKPNKVTVPPLAFDEALAKEIEQKYGARLHDALDTAKHPKKESYHLIDDDQERDQGVDSGRGQGEAALLAMRAFERLREKYFRDDILQRHRRPDARAFDEIRQITCEVGVLPRAHGSALFTRGETQALATTTLGTKEDKQRLDLLFEDESFKRFMLHYNFPPFSVGEVKFLRGPGRREIGHGALAERALVNLLPPETDFPYAMRLVSDIMESNGSSSMATVCGGSLSLMDAGVPITLGLRGNRHGPGGRRRQAAVLTDIAGAEDHYGDMDFKVAGTRSRNHRAADGHQGRRRQRRPDAPGARAGARRRACTFWTSWTRRFPAARDQDVHLSLRACIMLQIPTDKIRDLIGPGGKKIRSIIEATGVKIDVMDDGKVHVFANNGTAAESALQMIRDVTAPAEIGKTYLGKVVRLAEFGAFVEIFPGTDGLLHISEIAEQRIRDVRDELKLGDQVLVKVLAIEGNKIRLSRKAVLRDKRKPTEAGTHSRVTELQLEVTRGGERSPPLFYSSRLLTRSMRAPTARSFSSMRS